MRFLRIILLALSLPAGFTPLRCLAADAPAPVLVATTFRAIAWSPIDGSKLMIETRPGAAASSTIKLNALDIRALTAPIDYQGPAELVIFSESPSPDSGQPHQRTIKAKAILPVGAPELILILAPDSRPAAPYPIALRVVASATSEHPPGNARFYNISPLTIGMRFGTKDQVLAPGENKLLPFPDANAKELDRFLQVAETTPKGWIRRRSFPWYASANRRDFIFILESPDPARPGVILKTISDYVMPEAPATLAARR
jgi:hypothetical protein